MERKHLTAALVALLGLGGALQAAQATPMTTTTDGTVIEQRLPRATAVSELRIADSDGKGKEASCKGKDNSCKGKDSSCKGKDSSCKGKDSAAKAAEDKKVSYVGGAAMYPNKDIIDNAVNSPIHTTLVAAVKAAGLVDTLKGAGPFTVFAPTDAAFKELPAGTLDSLLKPESKDTLTKILTYHVVSGNFDAASLKKQIKAGGGSASLKTVQGEELTAKIKGGKIEITDSKGNTAKVSQGNVFQSNGVIHVIDKVLMP